MTALACAVAVAMCVLVLSGPPPHRHLRRRQHGTATSATAPAVPWWRGRPPVLVLALLAGGALLLLGPARLLLTVTAALLVGGVAWSWSTVRRRRRVERRRRRTIELCDALSAELRSGQPSATALARVAEHHSSAGAAARACLLGGDVPAALRQAATAPGAHGMALLAAAWQVAETSGCGLVATLDRVAESLRADDATSAEVAASLSPARATARMLAVLPGFGLLLGAGLGGDPLALLVGTTVGNALLLAGVALALAGTVWVERLTARVESR